MACTKKPFLDWCTFHQTQPKNVTVRRPPGRHFKVLWCSCKALSQITLLPLYCINTVIILPSYLPRPLWVPPSFENEIIFQHLMIKDKFFVSDKNICSVAYWLSMLDQNSLRNTKHWLSGDPTPAAVMFVDIRILDPLQWSCCCCFWWWWWR